MYCNSMPPIFSENVAMRHLWKWLPGGLKEPVQLEGEPNLEGRRDWRVGWGWGIHPKGYNAGSQVLLVCATEPQASHRISCPVTLNHVLVGNVLWGVVGGTSLWD